jgi:hypothetical protein
MHGDYLLCPGTLRLPLKIWQSAPIAKHLELARDVSGNKGLRRHDSRFVLLLGLSAVATVQGTGSER